MSETSNIQRIRGPFTSVATMMEKVLAEYPEATSGIIIVFESNGDMHTHFRCCAQEMALAGARMIHMAATDD